MARKTKEQARETRQQVVDAARTVFHRWGVNRSSLDMVAQAAGLTRGAVYWHFKNKAELFLAVREDALFPLIDEIDSIIDVGCDVDPLGSVEAALRAFFRILEDSPDVRMVFDTIVNRCEHVTEFANVLSDVDRSMAEILAKLESAYHAAAVTGTLRPGVAPKLAALDTWAFASGLMYRLLTGDDDNAFRHHASEMIALHMSLRRLNHARSREAE